MFKFFLILFFSLFLHANKNVLIVNNDSNYYNDFKISYIEDVNNTITSNTIQNQNFKKNIPNKYSFGHPKHTIWLKVTLLNNKPKQEFVLNLNESLFDIANLYYFSDGLLTTKKNGLTELLKNREIKRKEIAFLITLDKDEKKTFYIKLESRLSTIINVSIATKEYYLEPRILAGQTLIIFTFGVMTFIILFNLFLYFSLFEKIYIYYVLYIFSCLMIIFNSSGFFVYLGLNNIIYEFQSFSAIIFIFFNLFSQELFDTKNRFAKIHLVLKLASFIFVPITLCSLFWDDPWIFIKNIHLGINTMLLLFISIYIYFKENKRTQYYIFALICYVSFVLLSQLMIMGVLDYGFWTRYGFIVGILIENIIFSLLLASRYHHLNNELIEIKNENETYLKNEVENQTKQLKSLASEKELLLKEVIHRVKNNFHVIIGAIWFESRKKSITKDNFIELINRVQSMSYIHNFLYAENDVSNIEINHYIKILTEQIVLTYKNHTIKLDFIEKEKILLNLEYASTLGIITNEIVTNIIKHNPDKKNTFIQTTTQLIKNTFILDIKYEGKKFDFTQTNKGLGLKLIEDFSKNLPLCHYTYIFKEDNTFRLTFQKESNE